MISVVVPTYNRAWALERALESLFAQTLSPLEIVVVDDGSSDNTPLILKSYQDRISVIRTENRGVSHARNVGIKASRGEWIAFLDSDDVWDRHKLQHQRAFHKANPHIYFSHTHERWIRAEKEIKQKKHHQKPQGWCFEENLPFCKIAPSTVMMRRSLFEDVGYFDESLAVCEDYDLWLRVTKRYEVGLIPKALTTKYGGHEDQLSMRYHSMDKERIHALLKHKDHPKAREEIIKKCNILINGARKRDKLESVEAYVRLREEMSEKLNRSN